MLESEIKKLNAQLETLNANFEKLFAQSLAAPSITVAPDVAMPETEIHKELETMAEKPVPKVQPKKEVSEPEPAANEEVTLTELKALCLNISRNNPEKKAAMKFLLSTFDAKKVSDIKPEDRVKAKAELETL